MSNITVFERRLSEGFLMLVMAIVSIICLSQIVEVSAGECLANIACGPHGNCSGYSCQCETGYVGTYCEYQCNDKDCNGHGKCNPSYYGGYSSICLCDNGYGGVNCSQKFDCSSLNNCSSHGYCSSDNYCTCDYGWTAANCSLPIICTNVKNCSNHGYCSGYQTCNCNQGWTGADCNSVYNCSLLNNCNGRGVCAYDNYCYCDSSKGYYGVDCTTPYNCSLVSNCSGNGVCTNDNYCSCNAGYYGNNCSLKYECVYDSDCSSHGYCSMYTCSCYFGWEGEKCQKMVCPNNCNNHGNCSTPGYCTCNSGWLGDDCSYSCDGIGGCGSNGYCAKNNTCSCYSGWQGVNCNIYKTPNCSALNNCSGNGYCQSGDYCSCYNGYYGEKCDLKYNCNSLKNCSGHGYCYSDNRCTCDAGFGGSDCSSKPNCSLLNNCSGHGVCTYDNYCICNVNYGNADCSLYYASNCSALNNCSGHGSCVDGDMCQCKSGWRGSSDCSTFSCDAVNNCTGLGSCIGPNQCSGNASIKCYGVISTSGSVCSGNGTCVATDTCQCKSGYRGSLDCSSFSCDGVNNCAGLGSCIGPNQCSENPSIKCYGIISTSGSVCSGKGTCVGTDSCQCVSGAFGQTCNSYASVPSSQLFINSVSFKSIISIPVTLTGPSTYSFTWKQVSGSPSLQLSSITVGGIINGPGLYINANSETFSNGMVAGETYKFQVNITSTDGYFTVLESSVKVGLTPILKATIVNPSDYTQSGVAVTTKFSAAVQEAYDPNDSQATLMYGYGFYTESGLKVVSVYSSSKQANLTLPYQTGGVVTAFVYVINAQTGNQKELKFAMNVSNPTAGKTASEVNTFVQNLVTSDASISQLSIAVQLLTTSSSSSDSSVVQQRTEIKQQVITNLVSKSVTTSAERDTLLTVLVSATQSANEVSTISVTKSLDYLTSQPSLAQNFNPTQLAQLASQILSTSVFNSTTSSATSTTSKQVRTIIDAAMTATASSLAAGQSAVKTFGNIVVVVSSNTLANLQSTIPTNSISSIGIKSISLPTSGLQSLFSNSGIPLSTLVSLSLSTAPTSMYSFTQTKLASSLARIALINSNSASAISVANLTSPIEFNLQVGSLESGKTAKCKYFNEVSNTFTTDGIETVVISSTEIKCRVNHLTDFAIVPESTTPTSSSGTVVKPKDTLSQGSSINVTTLTMIVSILFAIVFIM